MLSWETEYIHFEFKVNSVIIIFTHTIECIVGVGYELMKEESESWPT